MNNNSDGPRKAILGSTETEIYILTFHIRSWEMNTVFLQIESAASSKSRDFFFAETIRGRTQKEGGHN